MNVACVMEINSSCSDCAGVPNGDNWLSDCGCVAADNSGDDCDDCAGIPNGDAVVDECDVCNGDGPVPGFTCSGFELLSIPFNNKNNIASGWFHTVVINPDGTVTTWGRDFSGSLDVTKFI